MCIDQSGFPLIPVSVKGLKALRISVRKIFIILFISHWGISGDDLSSSHEEVFEVSEHTDEMSECSGFRGMATVGDDGDDVTMASDCSGVSLHATLDIDNASKHGVNESRRLGGSYTRHCEFTILPVGKVSVGLSVMTVNMCINLSLYIYV